MIRRLRSRHRLMILVLGLATAMLVLAGLRARREIPANPSPLPTAAEVPR